MGFSLPLFFLDTVSSAVFFVLGPLGWAALFWFAWERPALAEAVGFGRPTFWVLFGGGVAGLFALIPFAWIRGDVLAVSWAGGLFPLVVGAYALGTAYPPFGRTLALGLGLFAAETAGLLLAALLLPPIGTATAAIAAAAAAFAGISWTGGRLTRPGPRRAAFGFVGIASLVLALTFLFSAAVPGVGITEPFPLFLIPPVVAAGLAAGFEPDAPDPIRPGRVPVLAFVATAFGVLVGADVLREPPLYAGPAAGSLYAIGGAGPLDLLYLSPLLAFAVALALSRPGPALRPAVAERGAPTSFELWRRAAQLLRERRDEEAVRCAARASRQAADEVAAAQERSVSRPKEGAWAGLAVPEWVEEDAANLERLAGASSITSADAERAVFAARALADLAHLWTSDRFARPLRRAAAFGIDLALVTAPAALLWVYWGLRPPVFVAEYGYIGVAFLYFVLTTRYGGRSVGKRLTRLRVQSRLLRDPGLPASLAREVPKLAFLSAIGVGTAAAVALLDSGSVGFAGAGVAAPNPPVWFLAGFLAAWIGLVLLLGAIGLFVMALTRERQGIGDLWGGTYVVRPGGPTPPSAPLPPAAEAPEERRSG